MQIRAAQKSDCAALAEIYQQSLDAKDCSMEVQVDEQHFLDMLEAFQKREVLLVVEDEEKLYGYGAVKKYSDRVGYRVACETSIYLRRDITGRGYGSRLQQALISRAQEFGYHHIVTKIWTSNAGSLRFHEKFGFETVGVQKEVGYLGGQWRDVTIMQCLLSQVPPYRPELG